MKKSANETKLFQIWDLVIEINVNENLDTKLTRDDVWGPIQSDLAKIIATLNEKKANNRFLEHEPHHEVLNLYKLAYDSVLELQTDPIYLSEKFPPAPQGPLTLDALGDWANNAKIKLYKIILNKLEQRLQKMKKNGHSFSFMRFAQCFFSGTPTSDTTGLTNCVALAKFIAPKEGQPLHKSFDDMTRCLRMLSLHIDNPSMLAYVAGLEYKKMLDNAELSKSFLTHFINNELDKNHSNEYKRLIGEASSNYKNIRPLVNALAKMDDIRGLKELQEALLAFSEAPSDETHSNLMGRIYVHEQMVAFISNEASNYENKRP